MMLNKETEKYKISLKNPSSIYEVLNGTIEINKSNLDGNLWIRIKLGEEVLCIEGGFLRDFIKALTRISKILENFHKEDKNDA